MTCHFNTTGHDGRDLLPVRLGLRSEVQLACSGCRTEIARHGFLRVVDRRVTDLPVIHERRGLEARVDEPVDRARRDGTGRLMYQAHRPNRVREVVECIAFFAVFFGIVVALSAVEPVR